jgi:hypothetical protein
VGVGNLAGGLAVVLDGHKERLGLLVPEVVGQVLVVVGLAPLKRQPLAGAGHDVAAQLRALAGQKVADVHAQRLGDIEEVAEGKIPVALLVLGVVLKRHARRFGDLLLRQAADLSQIANPHRDRLYVLGHLSALPDPSILSNHNVKGRRMSSKSMIFYQPWHVPTQLKLGFKALFRAFAQELRLKGSAGPTALRRRFQCAMRVRRARWGKEPPDLSFHQVFVDRRSRDG